MWSPFTSTVASLLIARLYEFVEAGEVAVLVVAELPRTPMCYYGVDDWRGFVEVDHPDIGGLCPVVDEQQWAAYQLHIPTVPFIFWYLYSHQLNRIYNLKHTDNRLDIEGWWHITSISHGLLAKKNTENVMSTSWTDGQCAFNEKPPCSSIKMYTPDMDLSTPWQCYGQTFQLKHQQRQLWRTSCVWKNGDFSKQLLMFRSLLTRFLWTYGWSPRNLASTCATCTIILKYQQLAI